MRRNCTSTKRHRKRLVADGGLVAEGDRFEPYAQESLLLQALPEIKGDRVICTSLGLAQFGRAVAETLPKATVHCPFLDEYRAELASNYGRPLPSNLIIDCSSDLPDTEAEVVALPLSAAGEAELARDLLQTGNMRLCIGGRLFATTDNCRDTWLGEQIRRLFRRVERRAHPQGVLYVATKTEPLKKAKEFACEFAFRDQGRLLKAYSRPGVFAHRRIDLGARRLIDEMQVVAGMRVLDLGCGSGVVSLAAACRVADTTVHAVDSNSRAVQCTSVGAELNGLLNITTELNCRGTSMHLGEYDLVLTNPPYYSSFAIASRLLMAGRDALRVGGSVLVVTKFPRWYEQNMPRWFDNISMAERKKYHLFRGIKSRK